MYRQYTKKNLRLRAANMVLTDFTYVFAIGTMFALLEAYNNGASKYNRHPNGDG